MNISGLIINDKDVRRAAFTVKRDASSIYLTKESDEIIFQISEDVFFTLFNINELRDLKKQIYLAEQCLVRGAKTCDICAHKDECPRRKNRPAMNSNIVLK